MRPIPSSRSRFFSLHLLALLTHGAIYVGQGAQQRYPGSHLHKSFHDAQLQHAQRNDYDRQRQEQRLPQQVGQQQQYQTTLATLSGITGGSSFNNRKKRQHAPGGQGLVHSAQRGPYGERDDSLPDAIEVSGADLGTDPPHLDGVYIREREAEINGAPHFKRRSKRGSRSPPVHLFFTGREWMLHLDADSELDINHCLAYSEVSEINPLKTNRRWAVRVGQAWVRRPHMKVVEATTDNLEPKWIAHEAKEPAREPQGIVDPGDEGRTLHASTTYNSPTVAAAAEEEEEEAEAGGERRSISDAALNRRLLPLYLVFVLDAIGLGVALPVLPFYVMGLQATALQLAVVISSNYIAQSFGCIITGNLSDVVGRKPVIIGCLLGTVISNIVVARSKTLAGVAWGRIIGGITGGLTPIAQAAVADVVPVQSLPKFLGRIQACVGLGFVLGPMTMTILHRLLRISSGDTFYAAALFPLVGLLFAAFRVSETKVGVVAEAGAAASSTPTDVTLKAKHRSDPEMTTVETRRKPAWPRRDQREEGRVQRRESVKEGETNRGLGHDHGDEMAGVRKIEDDGGGGDEDVDRGLTFDSPGAAQGGVRSRVRKGTAESKVGERVKAARAPEVIPRAVMLLVGNGFLLMYAFSIETIYAMFLKDNFGYGESVLSMVFALNGLAVGALQLLGMRHLVRLLGKHVMLIAGNVLLAAGMVGVALSRKPAVHFALFTVHIMGYSLADTALVALISRYSSPGTQGRSLGLNQAAQSMARVVSPVVAGVLYEWSKRRDSLPLGALPYLVGATFPLAGVAVPFWLYLRSIETKKQIGVNYTRQEDSAHVGRGAVAESGGVAFASGKSL